MRTQRLLSALLTLASLSLTAQQPTPAPQSAAAPKPPNIPDTFTNLIVLQRAYQANAKVITTVDQISQETISLKQ